MAAVQFVPLAGCLQSATERQTVFENSELHLWKAGLTVTGSTTLAELEAVEADYDTYAPETLAAWFDPGLAPGSGYEIISPLVQFQVGLTDPVEGNTIGGWWLQDADGNLRMIGTFDPTLPMEVAGQIIPLSVIDLFPTGFTGA